MILVNLNNNFQDLKESAASLESKIQRDLILKRILIPIQMALGLPIDQTKTKFV